METCGHVFSGTQNYGTWNARIGGYRNHDSNRAALLRPEIIKEMENVVEILRKHVDQDGAIRLSLLKDISHKGDTLYTNNLDFATYKVLDHEDGNWEKERNSLPHKLLCISITIHGLNLKIHGINSNGQMQNLNRREINFSESPILGCGS